MNKTDLKEIFNKHQFTETDDSQATVDEIMYIFDNAIQLGLENAKKSSNHLEDLLKKPGAELRIGDKGLVFNKLSECWTILDYSSGMEEIEANYVKLEDVKKYLLEE